MKRLLECLAVAVVLSFSACTPKTEAEKFVDDLMGKMTLREKLGQMTQVIPKTGVITGPEGEPMNIEELKNSLLAAPKNGFARLTAEDRIGMENHAKGYAAFIDACKTEREAVTWSVELLKKHGFLELVPGMELKAGDTLLLECSSLSGKSDFTRYNLLDMETTSLYKPDMRTLYSSLIMIAMVAVSSLGYLSLLQAAFVAAFAMIICRFCTIRQARESIDWSLLMIFAGSISLGTAIQETGIAQWISDGILSACNGSPIIALASICLVGTFITEFTSNTATAAIFFPIAFQTAVSMNVNPLTFCVALMISVSSSFATPIGSPTHMIVYGPGGYRFSDFAKIGIPMNLIIWAANLFITLMLFPL